MSDSSNTNRSTQRGERPMRGPARMDFASSRNFQLTFGKYKSLPSNKRTLDAIAETDEGLRYLDWLLGALEQDCKSWQAPTLEALEVYLGDPTIAKEVARVTKNAGARCRTEISRTHAERERQLEMGW